MPRALYLTLWCAIPLALGGWTNSLARAQEVQWRADYNTARQEAVQSGKPLIIDIGTENCYWCKQLDQRTFKDANLIAYLNAHTIPLRIDAGRSPALPDALNIQSYPTLLFAAPDGRVLGVQEGYIEASQLSEQVQRVVSLVVAPEWMVRDFQEASRAASLGETAKAISLLQNVVDDGKDRLVQIKARQLLQNLEKQAANRLAAVQSIRDAAQTAEELAKIERSYVGTPAAREAAQRLATHNQGVEMHRTRHAQELLAVAKEDFRLGQYACCLDRCEMLTTIFSDLPQAADAVQLLTEIKNNPEWMKIACDQLGERLSLLYLGLAESWLKKGQPQQAAYYLERVVQAFPNSRYAEAAQIRLAQIQGGPAKTVDFKRAQ